MLRNGFGGLLRNCFLTAEFAEKKRAENAEGLVMLVLEFLRTQRIALRLVEGVAPQLFLTAEFAEKKRTENAENRSAIGCWSGFLIVWIDLGGQDSISNIASRKSHLATRNSHIVRITLRP